MPEMYICDATGRLLSRAIDKIWATMLVPAGPEDEAWKLHVDAQIVDEELATGCNAIALQREIFVRLYNAGRPFVISDQKRRQRIGEQVGDQMLTLKTLDRYRPELASREKAARMHAFDMAKFHDPALVRDTSKLGAKWREYAPSAALWAAWRLLCRSREHGVGASIDWPLLLAIAERFRIWGEHHHRPVGRTGSRRAVAEPALLRADVSWRAPEHAALPHDAAARLDRLQPGLRFEEMIKASPA